MKKLILFLLMLMPLAVCAQEQTDVKSRYSHAVALYENGNFDQCEEELLQSLRQMKGMMKDDAFRIMALCRIEKGDIEGARGYVAKLLANNPFYNASIGDPQRFMDLVESLKQQEAGITTASKQAETVEEAPVPVTLITEDMIRHSGCQTIDEVLCLYVPGMSMATGLEANIAMHGVFSLSQEKILFMLDGHRLNSHSTNAEAPDYRTSLDKIQQIEVLRGPASSLYGNVALTAVVNIITRKGAQMNGVRMSGIFGTQKSRGGEFIVGGGSMAFDILGWGSLFATDGFKHEVQGYNGTNTLYSGAYNRRPAYDIGLKARWRDFSLAINMQRSKRVPYLNVLQFPYDQSLDQILSHYPQPTPNYGTLNNFDYDSYGDISGDGPGITRTNQRVTLDYRHSFGKIELQANGYMSMEKTLLYNVMGDTVDVNVAGSMLSMLGVVDMPATTGIHQKLEWHTLTFGGQLQGLANYDFLGRGTAILGVQYETFSMTDGSLNLGHGFKGLMMRSLNDVFEEGDENTISAYTQIKHFLTDRFIMNFGLRYDHKDRFSDQSINHLSPRLSMIYKLTPRFSVRAAYNHSFVDAPYLYRASKIKVFSGGADMLPETMNGFNLGVTYHNAESKFSAELEGFYNILNDLYVLNSRMKMKEDVYDTEPIFVNSGKVRAIGVESSVQWSSPRLFTNVNATWQRIFYYEDYLVKNGMSYSTPELMANTVAAYSPYIGKGKGLLGGKLWLRCNLHFQTATYCRTVDYMSTFAFAKSIEEIHKVSPQCNVGLGIGYEWKYLDIDLSLKSLTDNQYPVGSMLVDTIPHVGRQFLAKVTVKL